MEKGINSTYPIDRDNFITLSSGPGEVIWQDLFDDATLWADDSGNVTLADNADLGTYKINDNLYVEVGDFSQTDGNTMLIAATGAANVTIHRVLDSAQDWSKDYIRLSYYIPDYDSKSWSITGVNTTTETITILGNWVYRFLVGDKIYITGSTGNDGEKTVASAAYATGYTTITVDEDLTDATVDGNVFQPYIDRYPHLNALGVSFVLKDSANRTAQISTGFPFTKGYHSVEVAFSGLKLGDAAFNSTDIKRIEFIIWGMVAGTRLYLDSLQVIGNETKPRIILTFDNGDTSLYDTVRPLLNARGLKGIFYQTKSEIDVDTYMTTANLLQLQKDGHVIGNHTVAHRNWALDPWPTYREMLGEIVGGREWLNDMGIGAGREYFAHPTGTPIFNRFRRSPRDYVAESYDSYELLRFIVSNNYHMRLTSPMLNGDGINAHYETGTTVASIPWGYPNTGYQVSPMFAGQILSSASFNGGFDGTPATGYLTGKQYIDRLVEHNDLGILYWHSVKDGGDITEADFTSLLDYIIAQGVEVVTFQDLISWNAASKTFTRGIINA